MTPPLKRFILVYLAVQLAIIVIFLAVLSPWLKNQLIGQAETRLVNLAETFAEHLRQGNQKLDSPEALRSLRPMAERTGLELVLFDKDSNRGRGWC